MKRQIVLSLIFALTGPAWSADKPQDKGDPAHEAMMAKWAEFSTPSAGHRVLDAMVGEWDHTVRFWMAPGAAPQESKGFSVVQWIMGGRYLRQDVMGTAMGKPFEGIGITAYDNLAKRYEGFWIDNMGTGVMKSTSRYDAAANSLVETGTMPDPHAGKTVAYRGVTKFVDKGHFTYEMYSKAPDGKEFLSMKIDYTRKP